MLDPLMLDAVKVVSAYPPAIATAKWTPLRSAGGFSGARLWRGMAADGREFALKAHPPGTDASRLESAIHRWMQTAVEADLDFVPTVERTTLGRTVFKHAGRAWDVMAWMPGKADFHSKPTDTRLVAAVTALARLHACWTNEKAMAPCPAMQRRRQALWEWGQLLIDRWRPVIEPDDPARFAAEAAWSLLPRAICGMRASVEQWLRDKLPVQPCVCDIWHDHVFFDMERVTGIIDFAAAKFDHVAVDLARLLGSLVPDDTRRSEMALAAYTAVRPLPQPELVSILDRTGTAVAVMNWLRWLYHDGRDYSDRNAVAERLAALVRRLR